MLENNPKHTEYTKKLKDLRLTVNKYELTYNDKKRNFKGEIQLDQEKQYLDFIEEEQNENNKTPGLIAEFDEQNQEGDEVIKKGGWINDASIPRKSSIGVNKMMTEEDMSRLSKAELRKCKEQLITDMLCGIPESLQIDLDAQQLDSNSVRFCALIKSTMVGNWLKDPYSAVIFFSLTINFTFFVITWLFMGEADKTA